MSWKESNPMELWRNSTTLPVPSSMVPPQQPPDERFANKVGTMRNRLWHSLEEMNSEQRKLFFESLLHVWPYPMERRAIKQSRKALVFASTASAGYITSKVCIDVFLVDSKIGIYRGLKKCPTRTPFLMATASSMCACAMLVDQLVYGPFVESEGTLRWRQMFWRAAGIALLTGVVAPCFSAPVAANYHNLRLLEKAGKAPEPLNPVLDLITTCWESTRTVWRRLPWLAAANVVVAGVVVACMGWGRERLHDTLDLDPELVRKLMSDAQQRYENKSSIRMGTYLKEIYASTFGRANHYIKFSSPIQSNTGPKWDEKEEYGTGQTPKTGISLPPMEPDDGDD